MPTDPARRRIGVRFDERIWADATRGFSGQSLDVALRTRRILQEEGVALDKLLPCESPGPDQTELAGCVKLYLPAGDEPPSQRPFAFVLQLARDAAGDFASCSLPLAPDTLGPAYEASTSELTASCTAGFPTSVSPLRERGSGAKRPLPMWTTVSSVGLSIRRLPHRPG